MENQVEKLKLEAKQGLKFDSSKIPYSSNYIFFDNKNKEFGFNSQALFLVSASFNKI